MHRKNIGIVVNSSFALMRTSRFLSRLCRDDHSSLYSNSISSLSSSSFKLISYTFDSPKEQQKNKFADSHRRLQFNSPHRLTRGGGQGVFLSPWRSFLYSVNSSPHVISLPSFSLGSSSIRHSFNRGFRTRTKKLEKIEVEDHGQRAVTTALWCNFLVFSLKFGVWLVSSSHVMLAEVVHSVADFANQALLAYGLSSSKRAPDAMHPYGYSKERFVWSLISAVGIFCLGSGATIVHGVQNLWTSQDGAAVTGLAIAAASLVAVNTTGNAIYDPIGSIVVGNLLGMVAIFLIQRNRHALIGRAIDDHDMERVLRFLKNDPVVDAVYDCKSEVIGPGFFRFKAEIDFNGVVLVQNYLNRTGREEWARQFRQAAKEKDDNTLLKIMSNYGEEVVTALGSEVDRLEKEIQEIVPGIRHVDIEAHNPIIPSP